MNEHKSFLKMGLDDTGIAGRYELESYNYSFRMETSPDDKMKIEPYCPPVNVAICGFPDKNIIDWLNGVQNTIDVMLLICDKNDTLVDKLCFRDAVCVGMKVSCSEGRVVTKLMFHADKIVAGDSEFDNRWRGYGDDFATKSEIEQLNALWKPIKTDGSAIGGWRRVIN
jgi:hypothetical protein